MTGANLVDGYPYDLAGDAADPPAAAPPKLVEMSRRALQRNRAAAQPLEDLYEVGPWRCAYSIDVLGMEANATNPHRDRASDGTIGDTRHAAKGTSDHLPLIRVAGRGIVRARDIDTDGLDLPAAFERGRQLARAGQLPQALYFILNRRITAPDFSRWLEYKGENPHIAEGHVSVSRDPARFDSRAPWGIFAPATPPRPAPKPPAKPKPPAATGSDLTGRGQTLRGEIGDRGPRVGELQAFLNRYAPAYSDLTVDGSWGDQTAGVLRQFATRARIGGDGRRIGPALAGGLWRAGFDRTRAQATVRRHLARKGTPSA